MKSPFERSLAGEHAINGPSALHRRLSCPASQFREPECPEEESSESAKEGTKAHALLEGILTGKIVIGPDTKDYLPEMVQAVMESVRWVNTWTEKGYTLYCEVFLDPSAILGPETWGTSDIVLIKDGHVIIADFKYGQGHAVSAMDNPQLLAYSAGAYDWITSASEVPAPHTFTMVILQPRLPTGATVKTAELDTVGAMAAWAQIAGRLAVASPEEFGPEQDACYFCRARRDCAPLVQKGQSMVSELFTAANQQLIPGDKSLSDIGAGVQGLSSLVLSQLLDHRGTVLSLFDQIEQESLLRIRRGEEVPRFKIIRGRGKSAWRIEDDELRKKFKGMKLTLKDFEVIKIRSPAQMLKVEKLSPAKLENLEKLIDRGSCAERLVPSSAEGEEVVYNTAALLAKAEEKEGKSVTPPLSFL